MWTKFSNEYYPVTNDSEYDYIYFECNEPCAQIFLDYLDINSKNYRIIMYPKEPLIYNVIEYVYTAIKSDYCFRVRIYTMLELQELSLVSKDFYQSNLLIMSDNPTARQST